MSAVGSAARENRLQSIGGNIGYLYIPTIYILFNTETVQEFLQILDISVCRDALKKMYYNNGWVGLLKAVIQGDGAELESPEPPINNFPWCKCGKFRPMPLDVENFCCRKRFCVTLEEFFKSAILDVNVLLSIAIVNHSEIFADDPSYEPAS